MWAGLGSQEGRQEPGSTHAPITQTTRKLVQAQGPRQSVGQVSGAALPGRLPQMPPSLMSLSPRQEALASVQRSSGATASPPPVRPRSDAQGSGGGAHSWREWSWLATGHSGCGQTDSSFGGRGRPEVAWDKGPGLFCVRLLSPTNSCPQWGPMPARVWTHPSAPPASPAVPSGEPKSAPPPESLTVSMLPVWKSSKGLQSLSAPITLGHKGIFPPQARQEQRLKA